MNIYYWSIYTMFVGSNKLQLFNLKNSYEVPMDPSPLLFKHSFYYVKQCKFSKYSSWIISSVKMQFCKRWGVAEVSGLLGCDAMPQNHQDADHMWCFAEWLPPLSASVDVLSDMAAYCVYTELCSYSSVAYSRMDHWENLGKARHSLSQSFLLNLETQGCLLSLVLHPNIFTHHTPLKHFGTHSGTMSNW
jgi:hypothetical protein